MGTPISSDAHPTPRVPRLDDTWWLHPGKLMLWFMLPLYVLIVMVVPWLAPHLIVLRHLCFLDGKLSILGALCLGVVGISSWVGTHVDPARDGPPVAHHVRPSWLWAVGLVTLGAYSFWFAPLALRGQLFLERSELNHTPGITSFSQFGVVYVTLYTYATWGTGQRLGRGLTTLFALVLSCTALRVVAWSERLALIEVALPLAINWFAFASPTWLPLRLATAAVRRGGPLLGVPVLAGFFAATEALRSWSSYYQYENIDFVDFMLSRLVTYYYTALNNGAGMLATTTWPTYEGHFVLNWLHKLPLGLGAWLDQVLGVRESVAEEFLSGYADMEFNNPSGVFTVVHDLGVWGAIVYFSLLGLVMGALFRGLQRHRPLGVIFYPALFAAILEIMRLPYLGESRVFLVVLGALGSLSQLHPAVMPSVPRGSLRAPSVGAQGLQPALVVSDSS